MNTVGAETTNTAGPGSTVGIQAESVHNSTVYQVNPESPPSRKYEVGLRFLENGAPARARELIDEAIAHGYDDAEVYFHWALSMLSKRSYRDLVPDERERLRRLPEKLAGHADDDWKRASEVVCDLVDCLEVPARDHGLALKKLDSLPGPQRDKVIRHLDLVLTGGLKNSVWAETYKAAKDARESNDRAGRIWAYFQADPAEPRVRPVAAIAVPATVLLRTAAWSAPFTAATGYLGWSVLMHAEPLPILSYLLLLASGYFALQKGRDWHYRARRLREKEREHRAPLARSRAPEKGFANRIDSAFDYYFVKYGPRGEKRDQWLAETAGIRNTLRNEVVEIYRESRIRAEKVHWLIRFMARDVRGRWEAGTLFGYREKYKVAASTKAWCWTSCLALFPAAAGVLIGALHSSPVLTVVSALVAVVTGRFAAPLWLHISSEYRCREDRASERFQAAAERKKECKRWKEKLDATRPSEEEMEEWLNCDKTIILNRALKYHRLAWHDILAHAFLQTPHRPSKRARVRGGPWRYSKYNIQVFLMTEDGVHEVNSKLDFEHAVTLGEEREHFRFDAISSVHVDQTEGFGCTLKLTLMNGDPKSTVVTEPEAGQPDPGEDPRAISKISIDAAGFGHTLRILEGIAAEGKSWLDRDRRSHASEHSFRKSSVGQG
ncbi:hypothetical protein GCM10009799_14620 [Nocardiopsis rhodophaea]|uniref:Uncharacterized protein n=1 Tax=Nocardiopsis rhodophaea TaxID=280238 RepID=A0ABN2SP13_9ACTN